MSLPRWRSLITRQSYGGSGSRPRSRAARSSERLQRRVESGRLGAIDSPAGVIGHARVVADEPGRGEPGDRRARQGGGPVVRLHLEDPPDGRASRGSKATAAVSSASEADARPVSRLPYASMISTGRPPHKTRKLPGDRVSRAVPPSSRSMSSGAPEP